VKVLAGHFADNQFFYFQKSFPIRSGGHILSATFVVSTLPIYQKHSRTFHFPA
jgi:hypothetical protein